MTPKRQKPGWGTWLLLVHFGNLPQNTHSTKWSLAAQKPECKVFLFNLRFGERIMTCHATFASTLVPAKKRNLPNRILRAFDNAKHLCGLSRTVRDTLAEICRFVPQSEPFATVFAHKEKIAERIGASERTIYRHLNKLLEEGLIEVLDQERKSRNGRFSVARIKLTRKAATLLGFIEASSATEAPGQQDIHSDPSANMTVGHTLTEPTLTKNQPTQLINGIPVDLSWMTGNGLSKGGIFGLMAKAKAQGKRLSDIVVAVWQYIREIKGGRLYSYLLKLINGPSDFKRLAAQERQRLQERARQIQLRAKENEFKQQFKGVTLTTPDQKTLFVIDKNCTFIQVYNGGFVGTQPMTNLSYWISAIESGKFVIATKEIEGKILTDTRLSIPVPAKKQPNSLRNDDTIIERIKVYRHKRFVGPNGLCVKIFENSAEIAHEDGYYEELSGQGLSRLLNDIEAGILHQVDGFQDVKITKQLNEAKHIEAERKLFGIAIAVKEAINLQENRLNNAIAVAQLPPGRDANISLLKSILKRR